MREREKDQNRILFAAAALSAESPNLHLGASSVAEHAWKLADAMIAKGEALGFLEADAPEAEEPAPTTPTLGAR